ncbi:hypothetical protein CJI97_002155 [Candidozyma auris]|nr:hypothetical protein CJI97_002155 [[Candida] auris]
MDSFDLPTDGSASSKESFFAMLHQYLVSMGCSRSASILVEEAKVHFNSNNPNSAASEAYLHEWWCLLWALHNSTKNPSVTNMPPPPMPMNRVDARHPQFEQQQQAQQQQQQQQQQSQQAQQQHQHHLQHQQTQPPAQFGQPMQAHGQAHAQAQAPQAKQQKQSRKSIAERTPKTTAKAASSATTPAPPSAASQAGSESSSIMVPGQVPLTVGKQQQTSQGKRSNLQRPQPQPQQQPQQQAGPQPNRRPSASQRKQQQQQQQQQKNNQSNMANHHRLGLGNMAMPNQGDNFAMGPMNAHAPASAPGSAINTAPNSNANSAPNSEPNSTNFASQPHPMMPDGSGSGMNNGDISMASNGLNANGPTQGLNMDNDFGINFLGADLNMDLNGFDMASMLK